ncbi:MAG TPA: anhydro-N-acetylmuramic acid kinase [Rectinemataceae bacterium]|nr:anhydro-N-acetylmuramic acid kinase [Rectinemataceae bacterium]
MSYSDSYASKTQHLVLGLMSGTSLDGVDAVLVRIVTNAEGATSSIGMLGHAYLPYPDELRDLVARLCSISTARIDDLTYAHFGLSEWYARTVELVLEKAAIPASDVDAISMHGQTVWHAPLPRAFPGPSGLLQVKGTLQLGSAAVLRERTGIPVISDHRARDMAAGGEGAPLAPLIDALLFGSPSEGVIVQNIGGIGNATVIPAGAKNSGVTAFDTGPGNMVMDALVLEGTRGERHYDEGGAIAARGKVAEEIVAALMLDPWFARRPPKSTGREVYGADFAAAFLSEARKKRLSFEDVVATATAFTAESIAAAVRNFVLPEIPVASLLAAGGGARNATLLRMLEERLPPGIKVATTDEYGVPDQAREAMAFALIGHESLMGRPGNLPAVTGARHPVVLGSLTL